MHQLLCLCLLWPLLRHKNAGETERLCGNSHWENLVVYTHAQ